MLEYNPTTQLHLSKHFEWNMCKRYKHRGSNITQQPGYICQSISNEACTKDISLKKGCKVVICVKQIKRYKHRRCEHGGHALECKTCTVLSVCFVCMILCVNFDSFEKIQLTSSSAVMVTNWISIHSLWSAVLADNLNSSMALVALSSRSSFSGLQVSSSSLYPSYLIKYSVHLPCLYFLIHFFTMLFITHFVVLLTFIPSDLVGLALS